MPVQVTIPLLNPNEPEALLAALHVAEGQMVAAGEPLCTLETTKSTAELNADSAGYIVGLRFSQGQTARAGELLCYLAESADWLPPTNEAAGETTAEMGTPDGLRITAPALALARQLGVDLAALPTGPLITESAIRVHAGSAATGGSDAPAPEFDPTAIIVYGGGGHGKALVELLRSLGCYQITGIVDDRLPTSQSLLGLPVLGDGDALAGLFTRGVRLAVNAVGGIGDLSVRVKVFERLTAAGFACPAVIHPRAFVEASAEMSPGVQVFPHAYVGSDVRLGFGTIVNTGAIVSHDCQLGNYINISPGAILAGGVQVGDGVLVGMGATINLMVKIGQGARIGNGATVKSDVPAGGVVRAGSIYPE